MKTKQEIKNWILENCVDKDGNIDMSDLDFSEFEGNVRISSMKVKKDLVQSCQKVGGSLFQHWQEVGKSLNQFGQEVDGNLIQYCQKVGGDLYQYFQKVEGYAHIGKNNFAGIKEWDYVEKKYKITKEIDPYKDMTREDLIKEIKKLKGDK